MTHPDHEKGANSSTAGAQALLRDPRVSPQAGDVLTQSRGRKIIVVRTSRHRITYTYDDLPSMEVYTMLLSYWRHAAKKENWTPT